jgi:hypothetical protein
MPFVCADLSTEGYYTTWAQQATLKIASQNFSEAQNEMQSATLCILDEINKLSASSTDISTLQVDILNKTTELANAEKDIELAKTRVEYIRNPEQHTSNYESWFPIDRPIHIVSLFVLIGLTVFLGTFYILVILSAFDIDLNFYTRPIYGQSSTFMWISQQLTISFWIVLIVLISVVIYFVKRN